MSKLLRFSFCGAVSLERLVSPLLLFCFAVAFSEFAHSDSIELPTLEQDNGAPYDEFAIPLKSRNGVVRHFGRLKRDVVVQIRPGAKLGVLPENVTSKKTKDQTASELCRVPPDREVTQGRLLNTNNFFSMVELTSPNSVCGANFRPMYGDKKILFVMTKDITAAFDAADTQTEATSTPDRCENCSASSKKLPAENPPAETGAKWKSSEDLERYLACYPTQHQADYNRYYKKLLDLAGVSFQVGLSPKGQVTTDLKKAFEMPDPGSGDGQSTDSEMEVYDVVRAYPEVLKCLARRESLWNANIDSNTGASGLGQQTATNVADIHCLLDGCTRTDPKTKKKWQQKPTGWAKTVWNRFFLSARKKFSVEEWKFLTTNTRTGEKCAPVFKNPDRDPYCPINSLAAKALYQLNLELAARKRRSGPFSNLIEEQSEKEILELNELKALGHNAGSGSVAGAAGRTAFTSELTKSVIANTKDPDRKKELRDYDRLIKNCLHKDKWDPISDADRKRDCSQVQPP